MTFWVIDRKQFKQGSAIYIVRYHFYLLAEGSKKLVNHVNRPTTGRFVMFHLFLPLAETVRRTVKKKTALKTGQKVIGDDLHPLAEWWEVVAKDFWVLAEGLGKVVNDFWVPAEWSGIMANDFRPIVLKCFLSERQEDASLRWQGSCHAENNQDFGQGYYTLVLFHFSKLD